MKVKCPTCEQASEWSEQNPSRPFCSERCKLIDLGAWASEDYKIPVSEQPDFEELQDEFYKS